MLTPIVESTYLNTDMCKFESSQKKTKADGSRLIPRKHTETIVLLSTAFRLDDAFTASLPQSFRESWQN